MNSCVICNDRFEIIIHTNLVCRVILVDDKYYPGYLQVVLNKHIKELTDLTPSDSKIVFDTIWQTELQLRKIFNPDKINIASLGNMVPHLHWHIIPRFKNDRHFPNSIWGDITNEQYIPSPELTRKQLNISI